MLRRILTFVVFIFAVVFCGCSQSLSPRITSSDEEVSSARYAVSNRSVISSSVNGKDIECITHGFGRDVIFFIASIHGNEKAGTPLVEYLSEYLQSHQELLAGKKIVILPMANPDGFASNKRHNARGVDLNRNFPAYNRINQKVNGMRALCEPEARAIESLIRIHKPNRIIVFHQPLNCIDYDGPGKKLAQVLGNNCDLNVKKLGGRPGSLGSYAGETLGIPIITVEFADDVKNYTGPQMWERYGDLVLAAINTKH